MSKYESCKDVPTSVLVERLNQLSDAVTFGRTYMDRVFYMSIPARPGEDADLVLGEAARRLELLEGGEDG
jgi:hypothetical protein